MNNEKMIIDLKGDKLLLGSDFHTLADKTAATFLTNQIAEFVKFMKAGGEGAKILCAQAIVVAWQATVDRYTKPLAQCALEMSEPLKKLASIRGQAMDLLKFTEFLETYKRFTDAKGLELLASVRNFRLRKVVKVDVSKAKNGDFSYNVALETGGKDDFEPPELLVLEVPVFKFLSDQVDCIRVAFEVNFSIIQGEAPTLNFTLNNFAFDDEVLGRQVEIINRYLADLGNDKLWGSQAIAQQDDSWMYRPNPLKD